MAGENTSETRVTITASEWKRKIEAGEITPQNATNFKIVPDPDGTDYGIDTSVAERLTTMDLYNLVSKQINATNGNAGIKLQTVFDNPTTEVPIVGEGNVLVTSDSTGKIIVSSSSDSDGHVDDPDQITEVHELALYKISTTAHGHVHEVEEVTADNGITINNSNKIVHTNSITPGIAQGSSTRTLTNGGAFQIPAVRYDGQGHITETGTTTITIPTYTAANGVQLSGGTLISHTNAITPETAKGSNTFTADNGDSFDIPTVTWDAQGHITAHNKTTVTLPTFAAGDGIKIDTDGLTFKHTNAVTAGTASGSATFTADNGDSFDIPTVTYDAQGHVTAKGTTTVTLPEFAAGDGIKIDTDGLTFKHTNAVTPGTATGSSTRTLDNGGSFTTPSVTWDAQGHVTANSTNTITLPTFAAGDGIKIDTDGLTFKHTNAITAGTASGSETFTADNGDSFDIPTVTYDAQGHITGTDTTTVTLPTFAADDGIEIDEDGLTFKHTNAVTAGTASGTATKTLSNGMSFNMPTVTYDAQGHVTGKGTTTMTLPTFAASAGIKIDTDGLTFKHTNSITAGTASGTATSTLGNGGSFNIPTVTYDAQGHITGKGTTTITNPTYAAGDGIKIDTDGLTFKHTNNITAGTASGTTTTTLVNGGSFTTPTVTYDKHGHVTGKGTNTITIPEFAAANGIEIDEDGLTFKHTNAVTAGTASGSATGTLSNGGSFNIPTVTYDAQGHVTGKGTTTITIPTYAANTGLKLNGLTFQHTNAITAGTASGSATKTLTFGDTFTIPTISYDAQGHVTGKGTTTMTMPSGGTITSDMVLYTSGTGVTPGLIFQRGTLTDNYNDWKIWDESGKLYIGQRGASSTDFDKNIYFGNSGDIHATSFYGNGANITSINASNIESGTLSADRLAASGAIAGDYGPSADVSGANGNSITVPYITVDSKGRITATSNKTYTAPTFAASAGIKIDTDGLTFKHTNAVTAGTASGGSGTKGNGGNFTIPSISYDAQGHITGATTTTVTLPTYAANTGLKLNGLTFQHTNSITAGTASGSATGTLSNGGSFDIPTVSYDAQGHVTGKGTTTITIPTLAVGTGMVLSGTTVSAKLKSETASTLEAADMGSTSSRQYAVGPDKNGYLSVNIPWSNTAQLQVSDTTNKRINTKQSTGNYIQFTAGTNKFTVSDGTSSFDVAITPSISNNTTGSGLTANTIILGNGNSAIKTSGKSIETTLTTSSDNAIPTSKAVATYVDAQVANATHYRGGFDASSTDGTIDGGSTTLKSVAEIVGDMYVVTTAGTYAGKALDVGDSIIFKTVVAAGTAPAAENLNFVQGTVKVENKSATLAWNSAVTLATVEGTNITAKLPANPNTDRYVNSASFASQGTNGASGTKLTLTRAGSDTTSVTATLGVATTTAAGVMSGDMVTKLNGIAAGAQTGTVTSVATGVGLTGGTISTSGTIKAKLRSETALTNDSAAATETSGRIYPVVPDKSGYLAVNVPWTDHTYTVNNGTITVKGSSGTLNTSFTTNQSSAATIDITPAGIGAATSGHTHATSIAASSGTNQLTLAASTKYAITAGGTSYVFTTPPNTTYSVATSSANGLLAATDKAMIMKQGTAHYGGTGNTTKIKININNTTSWMLSFIVNLYQGYRATAILVSGYQYGSSYWYSPSAVILGDSSNSTISVYFGYDSTNNLWVGFDGGNYTGVSISNVTNGYTQIDNFTGLFTISNVSSLSTIQTTITARAPSLNNHTHGISLAADSGTNQISLTANTKYKLTAGGQSIIFTTPADTNTWRPVGTGATDAAAGNHTHATSIATSSATNQITLAANTKYALNAGGTSYIFTTPPDSNTTYSAGVGMTLSSTTFKAKLRSETALTNDSAAATETSGRIYPVVPDKSGYLSVNVPWTDHTYTVNNGTLTIQGNGTSIGTFTANQSGASTINITPSNIGAATSGHTHSTSIATSSGTNQLTLAANTKYALTAGGTSYIFTTPPDTNTWRPVGTGATDAAAGNHTHTLSIAADSGTNALTLAASTKYKLTAGGNTFIFTTPPDHTYTVNNGTLTIQGNGTSLGTFTANQSGNSTINITASGIGAAAASHGNHVPATQTANNAVFLRNDNSWQTVTPANIGAATSGHTHTISIAASTGTNQISLAANTKYAITAGGNSYVFTTPADTNTTYSAGTGISLSGTTFSNSGVRSIATGSSNGTISVNTNGTSANVAVKGLGSAAYTASTAYAASSHDHHSTAYGTQALRHLASGTAAATTTNCPSGAWYGYHS